MFDDIIADNEVEKVFRNLVGDCIIVSFKNTGEPLFCHLCGLCIWLYSPVLDVIVEVSSEKARTTTDFKHTFRIAQN